ncbi:MAG: UDP-2,3-diacylglucosamine diphosphatase LpxI [Candidatus Omnitrophica bacterium]|nr:UDP-2,3-diacylglucosamine diphosphatase LpxI [Candidatus Omnitrophota bacterium]
MARIGLVAGSGKLPIIFSDIAKANGDEVIAFGIKGITDAELEKCVDKMHWLVWGDLKKAMMLLLMERIKRIVLLGKISKEMVFKQTDNLDTEAKAVMVKIGDKKDYSILSGVASTLKKVGVEVIDPTVYLKTLVPVKGVLTEHEPSALEMAAVKYGFSIARELAKFDIGQTIAVKDRTIIAVEAAEGTDETISRAGKLVKDGFVVIKVARPYQDMRFDIPLVGPDTLSSIERAGGTVLALESGKTLLIEKEELIKRADANDISVVIV